ncbi:hypothetical protein STEG23_019788, partial [Scotinomys teguina]
RRSVMQKSPGECDPPLEVTDLFVDIQDGKILMALLEVLSGRNLLHEYKSSSHRIFRLNNIAKALKFLEDSNVKLVSIDAAEIADGNPSLVLGLIWNIILFFQIKELTGNLSRSSPSSSLSPGSGGTDSDSSYPPTPTTERSVAISVKDQRKAIKTLLAWVQRKTRKYGVAVQDFAGSWRSGLAFLAVIKAIDPSLVDMKQALEDSTRENLEKAFSIAHDILHIPRLLEPEDIMVDMPDEQSIVTYVAQFLERFPELEPQEDFLNPDREAPIESTFVRIKDSPSEQESRVLLLSENGERAYTVSHDSSHPPPAKVFVCNQPESTKGFCLGGVPSHNLSDSATELMRQIIDQVLQESPGKTGPTNEPAPESSILSTRKDGRRSNSLPIKKSVHFEADLHKDASCSKDPFYSSDFRFEGSPRAAKELLKQDSHVSLVEVAKEKKTEQEARPVQEAASDKGPGDIVGVDGVSHLGQPPQDPSFCNGTVESPASQGEKDSSSPSPGDHTILANSTELKVQLLTVEPMDKDDYFEGIPLKTSKFNRDLADFASTSQALGEDPSPRAKALEEGGCENHAEKQGKRKSKSPHAETESPESQAQPDKHESPPKGPKQEDQDRPLAPEETPADKKPEVYEKAKRKSSRHRSEEEAEADDLSGVGGEIPSNPPSANVSLETLRSHSEEGLDFKTSPPLSKISVIPHELFYYPHYEVPLAAVLEAYAEGGEDMKSEEEAEEGYLQDSREEEDDEEAHSSQSSCSFSLPVDNSHPTVSDLVSHVDEHSEGPTSASGPGSPPSPEDHQQRETKENDPVESQQPQEPPNPELLAKPIEEKLTEASTSSKKKEKRKHVDEVESPLFTAPGTVRSSDDLEENPCEHKVPSRNSHSDSSIYIRRHANRSLELDHFSYVQLRNAADLDERRNRVLNRTGTNSSGEAVPLGSQSPPNDSLTQFVQQPDVVYFILFLWLLVYCLLLFPQLDVMNKYLSLFIFKGDASSGWQEDLMTI